MPTPTELALSTLLPTTSFLPPDLVALANSLLAQSRSKAASLKPEEEIGRIYACAHIACERLKKRLDLEVDKPKPPCKPKVYQKLYAYLDGALSTPRTPTANRKKDALATTQTTPKGREQIPSRTVGGTPSKSSEIVKTPTTAGSKRVREEQKQDDQVSAYVMLMVRAICKATKTPSAVPHILVGARFVVQEITSRNTKRAVDPELPSAKRRKRTPQQQSARAATEDLPPPLEKETASIAVSKWPALLITLHTYVVARIRGLSPSEPNSLYTQVQAIMALQNFITTSTSSSKNHLPAELATRLLDSDLKKDITFYTLEASDCGWLEMDWYNNVPDNAPFADNDVPEYDDDEDVEMADSQEDELSSRLSRKTPNKTPLRRKEKHASKDKGDSASGALEDEVGAAGLLPGLGTMFQGSVDWLSDERREEFRMWKKVLLKSIAVVEAR